MYSVVVSKSKIYECLKIKFGATNYIIAKKETDLPSGKKSVKYFVLYKNSDKLKHIATVNTLILAYRMVRFNLKGEHKVQTTDVELINKTSGFELFDCSNIKTII